MNTRTILAGILSLCLFSCLDNIGQKSSNANTDTAQGVEESEFKYWTWITADPDRDDASYREEFEKYAEHGLDAVLINTNADPMLLGRLAPLVKDAGLELHAWLMAMCRPGDPVVRQHPEWYVVSREGKSAFDHRPYVDYYEFLCPTREASRQHVLDLVEGLAKVGDVASVHLDYIRYPDIFLPIGLLPKYDLVQEVELPQFDFCYCDVCVSEFEKIHHKNPREMENPAIDMEWKQFRLNKIGEVVDRAYELAHKNGKNLTAAVFPYPEMADHMVRQRWDKWKVDAVLPMIYHQFYQEDTDWVGFATAQGVRDLELGSTELHTGLFVPGMEAAELKEAISQAKRSGAKGVSFFDGPALSHEMLELIRDSK